MLPRFRFGFLVTPVLVLLAAQPRAQDLDAHDAFAYGVSGSGALLHGGNAGYGFAGPWTGNAQRIGNWGSYWIMDGGVADFGGPVGANGLLMGGAFVDDVPPALAASVSKSLVLSSSNFEYIDLTGHVGKYAGMMRGTLFGWVKTTSASRQVIVSFANMANDRHLAFGIEGGRLFLEVMGDLYSSSATTQSKPGVNDGQWHHVAAVVDGSGVATLYVDGNQSGAPRAEGFIGHVFGPDRMAIGRMESSLGAADYFDGQLSGVGLYGMPLTRANLQAIHSGASHPLPGFGPSLAPGPTLVRGSLAESGQSAATLATWGLTSAGDRYSDATGDRVYRLLTQPWETGLMPGTYYMSFLLRRDDRGAPRRTGQIRIADGSEVSAYLGWNDAGRFIGGTNGTVASALTMQNATTYFVVMKLFGGGADRISIKVYQPGQAIHPDESEFGATPGAQLGRWQINKIDRTSSAGTALWIVHDGSGPGTMDVDEIRFGKTWRSVTRVGFNETCLGSRLTVSGRPQLGTTFTYNVAGVRPNNVAMLLLGASRVNWLGSPLPLDLTSLGAPGCWLNVSADIVIPTLTNGSGVASVPVGIPRFPRNLGATLYGQMLGLDRRNPPRNPGFPYAFTVGHGIVIQR